jgi:hypothetical protein
VALKKLIILGVVFVFAVGTLLYAKDKELASRTVDSGSFGVFKNGQRVATETFSVQEATGGKIISSQLKAESGVDNATQSSELRLSPAGELFHYEWHEQSPSKADLTVAPNDQFLIEKITTNPGEKPAEQPFLMPASSSVLDNNSFVHREVLVWRYLASNCGQERGTTRCSQAPAVFGVIVPQDRVSMSVTLELVGREKVNIRGAERDLLHLNLKDDSGQWALWVDDQNMFKLIRIVIPSLNTEVLRD